MLLKKLHNFSAFFHLLETLIVEIYVNQNNLQSKNRGKQIEVLSTEFLVLGAFFLFLLVV